MSNQGVVPVVTNICMADPVQNQHTRFFSACSSVVGSLPDQDVQAQRFKIGCSFCSRPVMLAVLGVQNQHMGHRDQDGKKVDEISILFL